MKINSTLTGLISAAALMAVASTAAMAQQVTFASATGGGSNPSTVFTYTGGPTGAFTTTGGSQFLGTFLPTFATNAPATLTFSGFVASGPATGTGTALDPYTQALGGGSFKLTSGTLDLLDGTFTGGNLLSAISSSTTASITNSVNNVTYTGGSYFASSGLTNPGSFSVSMTSVSPAPSVSGGYLSSFTAGGTSTFSATVAPTTVPEPATVVPFAMGGLALLGLMARKSRRRSSVSA